MPYHTKPLRYDHSISFPTLILNMVSSMTSDPYKSITWLSEWWDVGSFELCAVPEAEDRRDGASGWVFLFFFFFFERSGRGSRVNALTVLGPRLATRFLTLILRDRKPNRKAGDERIPLFTPCGKGSKVEVISTEFPYFLGLGGYLVDTIEECSQHVWSDQTLGENDYSMRG